MSTVLAGRRPSVPPASREEQPNVDPTPKRHTGLKLGAVAVVWLVGWFVLKDKDTLALGLQDLTGLHKWINGIRDDIQAAAPTNWFLHGVLGNITTFTNWLFLHIQYLISTASPSRPVPQVGWLGVVAIFSWVSYALAGWRAAVLVVFSTLAFGVLGYWQESMDSVIVTLIAVVVCVAIGLPLGIAMARRKWLSDMMTPILDGMQTMPAFAYLIPATLFFGIGPTCAIIVTIIYAVPPLVRISEHGIRSVSPTTVEAASSLGVTPRQLLRQVQLPMARRTIVLGINQCTMAALSMATIAAFVNGPGLGQPVIQALQNLDVGGAAVPSIAIVVLAIMLDRTTTAASERVERQTRGRAMSVRTRRLVLGAGLVGVAVAVWLSRFYLQLATFPHKADIGSKLSDGISSLTDSIVNSVDTVTNGFKNVVSYGFLNPLQTLLADTPWWLMAVVLLALAFLLGGLRPTVIAVVCMAVILAMGLWNDTMTTLTTTIVATVLVMVVAVVLGVWMGRSRRADTVVRPFLDAFQTLPPFVYLVPALALFSASRFTAIIAAVAYAVPLATKLVADGIRGVSPTTVEAARASGSTRWQMITKVQLPMARPALVLATNQGLLYVLSMVVIGGMVGAGSLGYIVVSGFSQSQLFGKGLAAGIAITALGIMLDRIAKYTAARYGRG
jgi:glycine betaine/proline transport system permease protein